MVKRTIKQTVRLLIFKRQYIVPYKCQPQQNKRDEEQEFAECIIQAPNTAQKPQQQNDVHHPGKAYGKQILNSRIALGDPNREIDETDGKIRQSPHQKETENGTATHHPDGGQQGTFSLGIQPVNVIHVTSTISRAVPSRIRSITVG